MIVGVDAMGGPLHLVRISTWMIGVLTFTLSAGAQDPEDVPDAKAPNAPAPTYIPAMPPGGPPPFTAEAPYPAASAVETSFQPDEPDLRLLSLSSEIPYQAVSVVHRRWRQPRGYLTGYGIAPMYNPLCEGPCELRLMRGQYHWALSKAGGQIVPAEGTPIITGPSTLHAHYKDNSGIRTAGAVVGIAGTIGGIVMIFESFQDKQVCDTFGNCYTHQDVNGALLAGGLGVLVGSAIAAALMLSVDDEARITVIPLRLRPAGATLDSGNLPIKSFASPEGAAVAIYF